MSWTLGRIVREHTRGRGDRPMITYGERVITWSEMDARSSRVAQGLLAAGLAEQTRVAFLDKNGPEYFEVLFGGGKANVVNVAVNWRLTAAEMAYVINDAEAKILFVGPDFLGHLEEMEGSLKSVEKIVVLGAHARHESYEAWLARHPADDPGRTSAPDDVAMQLYTSGTTGLPKGAMLTNASLGTLLPYVGSFWHFDETSVNLVCMPLFHIGGSGWALVGMGRGCHSILVREFVPQEILAARAPSPSFPPRTMSPKDPARACSARPASPSPGWRFGSSSRGADKTVREGRWERSGRARCRTSRATGASLRRRPGRSTPTDGSGRVTRAFSMRTAISSSPTG